MAYLWRIVAVIGILLVLAGGTFYALLCRAVIPSPPKNADAAADRLLFDWKTGNLAIESAVAYGNEILPHLEEKTNGFERISLMQAPRLAEVLSRIDTPECEKLLQSLYATGRYGVTDGDQRGPSSIELPRLSGWWEEEGTFQKCVAAFALARQGKLDETTINDGLIANCLSGRSAGGESYSIICQALCALALGHSRSPRAMAILCRQLPRVADDAPSEFMDALAILQDREAVDCIQKLLQEHGKLPYYTEDYQWAQGFGERAIRALLALKHKEAIALLISHVHPEMPKDYWVIQSLTRVTGKDFGARPEAWASWWNSRKDDYPIDNVSTVLLEEVKADRSGWLENIFTGGGFSSPPCFSSLDMKRITRRYK